MAQAVATEHLALRTEVRELRAAADPGAAALEDLIAAQEEAEVLRLWAKELEEKVAAAEQLAAQQRRQAVIGIVFAFVLGVAVGVAL